MSPAELTLLRHAEVVTDDVTCSDASPALIESWAWLELPAGPTVELRRTLERLP